MTPTGIRTAVLAAKKETTLGTAIALANADAGFRVMNPVHRPVGNTAVIPAGVGNADIGVVTGMYSAGINFDIGLYEGTWRNIFMYSCGFDDTAAADTFKFTDDTTKWKGITAGLFYGSGKQYGMYGAMGSFGIRCPVGMPAVASFRYKGLYLAAPGSLPSPTWETSLPPVFAKAGALTIDADATVAVSNFELVADDYAFLIPSPNVAGACLNAWLKKPSFRIKVDPLQTSSKDWIADWLAGASHTIAAVLDGGTGNKITISATVSHVSAPDHEEEDEMKRTPLEFAVLNNSLSVVFA